MFFLSCRVIECGMCVAFFIFFEALGNFLKTILSALAKSGSFGFAEGSALCVGAKPNVPLVRLAKIVFKKVRWGEKRKTLDRLE